MNKSKIHLKINNRSWRKGLVSCSMFECKYKFSTIDITVSGLAK